MRSIKTCLNPSLTCSRAEHNTLASPVIFLQWKRGKCATTFRPVALTLLNFPPAFAKAGFRREATRFFEFPV